MNPANLPILLKGDRISAEHYAAVTRAARANNSGGMQDGDGTYAITPRRNTPERIQVLCTEDIDPFSVFEMDSGSVAGYDVTVFKIKKYAGGSILLANEELSIIANTPCWAYLIGSRTPRKVKIDTTNPPVTLNSCGPTTGAIIVSASGTALKCLAVDETEEIADVIRVSSGTGGAQIIRFVLVTVDCYENTATGLVTNIMCENSELEIGDTVELYDPLQYLTGNPDQLPGYEGFAVKMQSTTSYTGCKYEILQVGDLGNNC